MKEEKGSILYITLIVLMLLSVAGLHSVNQSTMQCRIAANNKLAVQAFFIAQAGIEEARVRLPNIGQVGAATSSWRAFVGDTSSASSLLGFDPTNPEHSVIPSAQSTLGYIVRISHKTESEAGLDLDSDGDKADIVHWGDADGDGTLEQNTTTGKPVEVITSMGDAGDARATITVEAKRDPLDLKYAVFGDQSVDTKNGGKIWKGAADTPYVAAMGSNGNIDLKKDAMVYGDMDIGKTADGAQGSYSDHGSVVWGAYPNYVERIDPDPLKLFVANSELDNDFERCRSTNSNGSGASPAIAEDTINLGNWGSMTLRGGSYYLASITLGEGATLTVDTSSGPVNIYLTGSLEAKNSGAIDLGPPGARPGRFTIYCKAVDTSSSSSIDIKNGAAFKGVIYAPGANISLHNTGDVYGMIWGRKVDIKNGGEVIYDPGLRRKFLSPKYTLRLWREER